MEPSILNVQARIGSGSYTTIKRFLDEWRQAQAQQTAMTREVPPELAAQGTELIRRVWVTAQRLLEQEQKGVREQAQAEIAAARTELAQALQEVQRLERIAEEQAQALEQSQTAQREAERRIAALEVEARQAAQRQVENASLRETLAQTEQDAQRWRAQAEAQPSVTVALDQLRAQVAALRPGPKK